MFKTNLILNPFTCLILLASLVFSSAVHANPTVAPQQLISRTVPAYTNDDYWGVYPASNANNNNYNDYWISRTVPSYLAYDVSSVPTSQRGQVLLVWFNEPATKPYNPTLIGDRYYRTPQNYTIEANAAPGGTYPTTGWNTLVTVNNNQYTSRQHLIDLTGYNWVRMNISSCPDVFATECSVNMDVYNASSGATDDWMFFGDSITQMSFDHDPYTSDGGTGTFSQLINAQNPSYFPLQQEGGIGGWGSRDVLAGSPSYFSTWLSLFPGNIVALNYGTNDANSASTSGGAPNQQAVDAYYNNMHTLVQMVLNAGKTPAIAKIPWGNTANIQANGPAMNTKIDQLYLDFPQIIHGPDLWTFFYNNQNLISSDNVHPTNAGFFALRQQWANTMLASVYTAVSPTPSPTSAPTPTVLPTATPTPVPTNTPTPTPTPDTTPPTVVITNSINGSHVNHGSTLLLNATATDDVGVTKVEFYVNNVLTCTDTLPSYNCSWTVPAATRSIYTVLATAYDAAGNTTSYAVAVTSQ